MMPRALTKVERREKALQAYQLFMRRLNFTEIGEALGVTRQTASSLVNEFQIEYWLQRDLKELEEEKRRAIETYEAIIRNAWQRLSRMADKSNNVTGLLNVIVNAQSRIDKLTGAEAPIKFQDIEEEIVISWPDVDDAELIAITDGYSNN